MQFSIHTETPILLTDKCELKLKLAPETMLHYHLCHLRAVIELGSRATGGRYAAHTH